MRPRNLLLVLAGLAIGMAVSARLPILAGGEGSQDSVRPGTGDTPERAGTDSRKPSGPPRDREGAESMPNPTPPVEPGVPAPRNSIQDSLLRPYTFSFASPTSLENVCARLTRTLGSPVVLDLAALERLDLKPEDTVRLELEGVRLKTGLKLLLDQVRLTYRVVAEDNLLIITDKEGSEDPLDRVWAELRELHRDVHDVQDALDELLAARGSLDEEGVQVRKPTIIEEMPAAPGEKPEELPELKPGPPAEPEKKPLRNPSARPRTSL